MFNAASYNPDVLTCLANLSSDEVFTPPKLVNEILDLLPADLWQDKTATFLDPCSKSGVFLREITKRLMAGLDQEIPDRQTRINHILTKQVFGIAITELTAHLSRRSLYCSKHADGKYSICDAFSTEQGNLRFDRTEHSWMYGSCIYCGANQDMYARGEELETHAYQFIHKALPEDFLEMKFDVIIGNPPYQLSDGGNAASALPIYQKFVEKAKKLNPRYLSMIIPARWYTGGRGLDLFRKEMLHDERIRVIHDFPNAGDCFPGIEIKGGVCFFLWDRDNIGLCKVYSHNKDEVVMSERPLLERGMDTFLRNNAQISVLQKVEAHKEISFSTILNAGRYFGFHTRVDWDTKEHGFIQTADGQSRIPVSSKKTENKNIKLFVHGGVCWIAQQDIPKNVNDIDKFKVIIPRSGNPYSTILGKPILSEPGTCSSNTYVLALHPKGGNSRLINENILQYISTKFFRFLVSIKATTQDNSPKSYGCVPIQDFSKPWTDEELYAKYGLTEDEIAFIESMIHPMDLSNGDEDA